MSGSEDQNRQCGLDKFPPLQKRKGGPAAWAQTFNYDPFGNLTKSGSISWQPGYNSGSNRYSLAGTSYDANGNLLNDTFASYTWDAEGENLSANYYSGSQQTWSLTYDAFGHQAELSTNGVYGTSYLSLGGVKLSAQWQTAEYSEYPLPGGSILSQGGGGHVVQMADWLETIRASWLYTAGGYTGSAAHAPFGETYANNNGGNYPAGFAGQGFSDANPTNTTYWFPERKLRSSQGRWLSPDPAGRGAADPSDPQSWNRYAYVGNNPLSLTDPEGLDPGEDCGPEIGANHNCPSSSDTYTATCPPGSSDTCVDVTAPFPAEVDQFSFDRAGFLGFSQPFPILLQIANPPNNCLPRTKGCFNVPQLCANVPTSPPGASATFNASLVKQEIKGMWPGTKLSFFERVFHTSGIFDYKTGGDQYVDYGNWNFGYVCGANYSPLFCQSAAGGARMGRALKQGKNPFGSGVPFVKSPFGDQARDNQQIRNGIRAQASGCAQ